LLEVLLITSSDGDRWGVPKGLVEPDMTPAESAANEAWEEAGVRGRVSRAAVGRFEYSKWGGKCDVEVFTMHVEEVLDEWPESAVRRRKWLPVGDAAERASLEELAELIEELPRFVA